jgi:uncharacterized protein with HEPN domain
VPSRSWKLRVEDILEAIAAAREYVEGMTFEDFCRDRRTVDAVIRRFIVIGEAAGRIPEEVCARNGHIPWADMRAVRNFVVHEYFGVGEEIIWDTIHGDLPGVVEPLERLLREEGD